MFFMRIGVEKGRTVWYNKKDYQALSSNKLSLIILMQFKKGSSVRQNLHCYLASPLTGRNAVMCLIEYGTVSITIPTLQTRYVRCCHMNIIVECNEI